MANQPIIRVKPAINDLERKRLWIETYFQVRYKFLDRGSVLPLTAVANLSSPTMSSRNAVVLGAAGDISMDTEAGITAAASVRATVICASAASPASIDTEANIPSPLMEVFHARNLLRARLYTIPSLRVGVGVCASPTVLCRSSDLASVFVVRDPLLLRSVEAIRCAAALAQPFFCGPITPFTALQAQIMGSVDLRTDCVIRGVVMVRLAVLFISDYDDGSTLSDICANDKTIFDFVYDRRS